MIDINTIISQALAAAVQQATAPLLERIAALEAQSANRHERLRVLEGALTDRVLALENNPAQGVDTTLEQAAVNKDAHERQLFVLQHLTARIAALETKLTEADLFTKTTEVHINKDELLEYLDNQEWFWAKIRNFTDTAVEQAIENHTDMYDHNDFVTEDKLDDYVQKDSFRDEIEDVLNNATIRIRF